MRLAAEPRPIPAGAGAIESRIGIVKLRDERQRILLYLIVGTIAFIIDAGLVSIQVHILGIGAYVARAPSFIAAVTASWFLNRTHTFKGMERHSASSSYRRYVLVQVIGGLFNLSVYVAAIVGIPICARYPAAAVALSAGFGMVVNYTLARLFVFPGAPR